MTTEDRPASRRDLIRSYNLLVAGIEDKAISDDERAYGGIIRAAKGKLVESMASHVIRLAWLESGGNSGRLSLGDTKRYMVPIQDEYIASQPKDIADYINGRKQDYHYRAQVDLHVFIDGEFVMGVECKSFTENAMLKRILVDFRLLKNQQPNLVSTLLQLESQLGGDYSNPQKNPQMGSPSSHTLMSYFPEVSLQIITLLDGERKINRPIHQAQHFKELRPESLDNAISRYSELLNPFI